MEKTDVVVIGAGQAGIAASEHLTRQGLAHIVLERDRIAESWRTRRWDSLVTNGPAWHDRFPGLEFDLDGDHFAPKETVAKYFETYVRNLKSPVREGTEVKSVSRRLGHHTFIVETSKGTIETSFVITATGAFLNPVVSLSVPQTNGLLQIHSVQYKHAEQLPKGGVLVVGAGASGVQIADEVARSGRKTYLSVGAHERPPRRYRDRDWCWWLGVLNWWDHEAKPGDAHNVVAVSGADGGRTMDFRELALRKNPVTLLGRTQTYENGKLIFAQDLQENIKNGDKTYFEYLHAADEYVELNGLKLPEEPQAHKLLPDPDCVTSPIRELDLAKNGIQTIIWATGFSNNYSWLQTPKALAEGRPSHHRGVSTEPGVYFLGLPWQTRRSSSFIRGVWYDAGYVVEHIKKQQMYYDYRPTHPQPVH